jgi:hypothetical protein
MIALQLSPELWRFALLVGILVFHKSAYKLVARIMDRLTSTASKSTSNSDLKSPKPSNRSTSPRLSSLHRRFRLSGSNSTSEDMSVKDSTASAPVTKSEAARSAKKFLISTIRDDWTYPPPKPQTTCEPIYREPIDYRIRQEGSSDPEPLSDEPYDARDPMVFTDSDPYKFESPDAVARTIGERKRKRQGLFREELEWNNGLKTWADRRNAWCGAVEKRPRRWKARDRGQQQNGRNLSSATDSSGPPPPTSQASSSSSSAMQSSPESEHDVEMENPDQDDDPLLPVYPSILPEDNLIRASIAPNMYPAIYSKVVLQSLTPTVPVPLPDVIGALVQGWKSEGNWPPRGVVPTTSMIQGGSRRASELLKFRRRESAVAEKGRMRKGVGAVKKALGLRTSNGDTDDVALKFEDGGSRRNITIDHSGFVEGEAPAPV